MKSVLCGVATFAVLGISMIAWSVAGRLLTAKDDFAVVLGVLVLGVMFGATAAGVSWVVKRLTKEAGKKTVTEEVNEKV